MHCSSSTTQRPAPTAGGASRRFRAPGDALSGSGLVRAHDPHRVELRTAAVSALGALAIALLGCDNLCVVHTKDATLVMPLAQAEKLKALHGQLPDELK